MGTLGLFAGALGIAFVSCATVPARRTAVRFAVATATPDTTTRADAVVVVTLDGTRWQDVFLGADPELASAADLAHGAPEELMPTLHRWMTTDGVAIGTPGHGEIRASGPNYVSLPGYTEIFTGRPSECQRNDCGPIATPTVVDELLDTGGTAAVVTSWERIARAATDNSARVVLSAGRHVTGRTDGLDARLLARDRGAGPWPGDDDYRPDALTAELALRLVDTDQPRFLFVGLGDPDEHAHHGDYAAYLASLRAADHFLGELDERVDEKTAILVTADHGRNAGFRDHGGKWPESARVWLVARGGPIAARGAIDTGTLHLADVAPTVRCLLGMRPDTSEDAGRPIAPICDAD